jgi:hypothetical protein
MPKERVVDVVPGAPDEDSRRGNGWVNANHIRKENGKISANDGAGQAETDVPNAVDYFLLAGEFFEGDGWLPSSRTAWYVLMEERMAT